MLRRGGVEDEQAVEAFRILRIYSLGGQVIIDRSLEILQAHRRQLGQNLLHLQERVTRPEAVEQQEFVNQLDAICIEGSRAVQALADYRS